MNVYADNSREDTSHAIANSISTGQSNSEFAFADNRPETAAQRKMQQAVTNYILGNPDQLQNYSYSPGTTAHATSEQHHFPKLHGNVAQRIVEIGTDTYEPGKRGFGIKHLIELVENNKGTTELRYDWKARIKEYVNDDQVYPQHFNVLQDLVDYLAKSTKKKKTQSQKNKEQDLRIQGLNTGYGKKELQYGKILSYESEKAFGNFTSQVENLDEYDDAIMELDLLDPGPRSTTNNFTQSNNPFINMYALGKSNLSRLDFMAPNNVEINTQGYSSMKDRTVDPHSLKTNFGYGTVKIGPNVSSYMKEMKTDNTPNQDQMDYLNSLEMHRFPNLAPQTGMKRELYNQDEFTKDQGMGFNHDHSSVEFVGAISGSSMTNQQLENMRKQQHLSNYAILETAFKICPDVELGQALSNFKHVPTPKEEMNALRKLVAEIEDVNSTQDKKNLAKKELRKVLTQVLRAVTQIEEIDSQDDSNYPTSPFNQTDYH